MAISGRFQAPATLHSLTRSASAVRHRILRAHRKNDTAAVIFSFNRPHYLEEVMHSIERNSALDNLDFYFYQDGAINKFSHRVAADQRDIDECLAIWRKSRLPNKTLLKNKHNLGIGITQFNAKVHIFDVLRYEKAIFLEDDLILGRSYLKLLRSMLQQFERCDDVGAVMCHGVAGLSATREEKTKDLYRLTAGTPHLWAWATWRDRWQKIISTFQHYYKFIEKVDYIYRPHEDIRAFFLNEGINMIGTSQDAGIDYAFFKHGLLVTNTIVNRSQYIGAQGIHFYPELFKKMGYPNVRLDEFAEDEQAVHFELLDRAATWRHVESVLRLPTGTQ